MQAKDLDDRMMLGLIQRLSMEPREGLFGPMSLPRGVMRDELEQELPNVPRKVLLAKMGKLIGRKLVDGCNCGCSGIFSVTDAGREFIGSL